MVTSKYTLLCIPVLLMLSSRFESQNSTVNSTNIALCVPPFPLSSPSPSSFNYSTGGSDWHASNNTCGGLKQSPINLDLSNPISPPSNFSFQLFLLNQNSPANFSFDQTINARGNFTSLNATDATGTNLLYDGVGFQVHAPSEHFLNSRLYDLEVQLIHKINPLYANLTNHFYAIVSLLYKATDGSFSNFFDAINMTTSQSNTYFNMYSALQQDYSLQNEFFMYQGSMSQPPCNETVNWFVMKNPIPVGLKQLGIIDLMFRINPEFASGRGNNRFIQDLNRRTVYDESFVNNLSFDLGTSSFFTPFFIVQ